MRRMDVATTRVASANQWVVVFVRCNGTAADVLKTTACAVIKMGVIFPTVIVDMAGLRTV